MLIALGFAVLILTIGMVVLFAMFGELSARVATGGAKPRSTELRALEDVHLGRIPDSWPEALSARGGEPSVLLVLSSACGSCQDIASQLSGDPGHADWTDMALVVSTGNVDTGQDFVMNNRVGQFPHYIDVGGEWVGEEFGVRYSPSALIFRDGQLLAAYMFQDVSVIRAKVDELRAYSAAQQDKEAV
jgi:hypothetical protein